MKEREREQIKRIEGVKGQRARERKNDRELAWAIELEKRKNDGIYDTISHRGKIKIILLSNNLR